MRSPPLLLAAAVVAGAFAACDASSTQSRTTLSPTPVVTSATATAILSPATESPTPFTNPICRSPREHVYNPDRLVLRDPCTSVSGTIEDINPESDGDYHILIRLDSQYEAMLNDGNRRNTRGDLVLEIVCGRKASGTAPMAACNGATPSAALPRLNAHVVATGAYVLDTHHGWMELHPIWDVRPG